jgi:ssDNA-binding Zn-finger/Zn-ribbon topoisomerase 1
VELTKRFNHESREPAEGPCDVCGTTVVIYSNWASECPKCGTEYNGSGQRLAPRSQWGEETGEHFA